MKKSVAFTLLSAFCCAAIAQATWPRQLADAIADVLAKAPANDAPKLTDWLQVFVGAIAAALTLVSTALLGWLAWKSAKAADLSAKAALSSASIASATQRPRFVVDDMSVGDFHSTEDGSLHGIIRVRLKNHGVTSAEVTAQRCLIEVSNGNPSHPQYVDGNASFNPGFREIRRTYGQIVSTNNDVVVEQGLNLSPDILRSIRSGSTKLWVLGCLSYRDYLDEEWGKGFIGLLPRLQSQQFGSNGPAIFIRPRGNATVHEFTRRGAINDHGYFIAERDDE